MWSGMILLLLLAACTPVQSEDVQPTPESEAESTPDPAGEVAPSGPPASPTPRPVADSDNLEDEPPPRGAEQEFTTDFSKHSISYSEVLSGGPPKDGIPAIDEPKFISVEEAEAWLKPNEPVVFIQLNGEAKAYPLQILMWHEIANDLIGETPVVVTFCPLCNTAIAFERTLDGEILDFGTTGRLRFSNLIMYDRQSETWWQQATGEAIAGEHTGRQLQFVPAAIIAWDDFKTNHQEGLVLSRETGFQRSYGQNPYAGYDDVQRSPFLYRGPETPDQLLPMARVLTVELGAEAVAYPYDLLQEIHVINDQIGEEPIVVLWQTGTASALDSAIIDQGRDVGTANSFSRVLDGEVLTFGFKDDKIVDEKTGSEWSVLGEAVSGPLAGAELAPVVGINHFWFSWAAFKPETRVYQASSS